MNSELVDRRRPTMTERCALAAIEHDVEEPLPDSAQLFTAWCRSALDAVRDIRRNMNLTKWEEALADFLERSHAQMPVSTPSQLWVCRKIYTDSSILGALAQARLGDPLKAIGSLDRAIVIAGAAGRGRLEMIQGLILSLQSQLPALCPQDGRDGVPKPPPPIVHWPLPGSSKTSIPRISAPSFLKFQSTLSDRAFIISGYAQHWPALNEHPWRRASYLKSVSGPGRLVPVEVGKHYLLDSWKQVILSWDEFLSSLEFEDQKRGCANEEIYYLAQHDLFMQFPDLQDDVIIPDYAYATLSTHGRPHYVPPSNVNQILINCWLGPEGTISPPHTDRQNNLYVQVVGQKTIWLAPPTERVSSVMSNSNSSTLANTSRYDVFAEEVDSDFTSDVVPHAMSATLDAGDLLYFPAGWWHAMRNAKIITAHIECRHHALFIRLGPLPPCWVVERKRTPAVRYWTASMYSGYTRPLAPAYGDRREPMPLTPASIVQALDRSPDSGVTLVFSKLALSDVSAEAAEHLATVGRDGPEDEPIVERITLGNNRLSTLPTEFALLSRLRYLNLKHNNFSNFPDVLTVMPSLDTLDISHNKIKRFPAHPGRLVDLRVFSFSKNKITRLPSYFPQFKHLELLKLDRNPLEWPPRNILQRDTVHDSEQEMKEWIGSLADWIDYNTFPQKNHDDSGYGETLDLDSHARHDKHKAWRIPLDEINGDPATPSHNRTYSVDSQASASSLQDDSLVEYDSTRNRSPAHFKRALYHPVVTAPDHSFDEAYLPSPADSQKFEHSSSSQFDVPHLNRVQPLHLRASSMATEQRQSTPLSKNSLPDLRSPQWTILSQSPEQTFSDSIVSQPEPNHSAPSLQQNSMPSVEIKSESQRPNASRTTPSMAFERNSYFQRLSTMPAATTLPTPLMCLVETARSVLFVTTQIYQTIENYADNSINENPSSDFKQMLKPASTDMLQLIQALDRFDSACQKALPPPAVCRAIVETCRNAIGAAGKAVGIFAVQLKVAPCEDHRYSRWILSEVYASTSEVSVAWQNFLPHMQPLKAFLQSKLANHQPPAFLQAPPLGPLLPPSHQGDGRYPAPRLRNTDLASLRAHNPRRHAGSFSYRDVELGKVLPSIDEPPSFSGGVAGQFPTLRTPKRQATAPLTAPSLSGSLSLPGPVPSPSRSEGASLTRHSRERSFDQPLRSAPTNYLAGSKLKYLDLPATIRQRPDREAFQSFRQSMEFAPKVWDMIDDSISPADTASREMVKKARDLNRRLFISLRSALDNDRFTDLQLNDIAQLLLKLLAQMSSLAKNSALSRTASPSLHAHLARLIESAEEFSKMLHASFLSSSSLPYSPPFSNPFFLPASLEDNRLTSSLSRTRSAQPTTPSLKTSLSSFQDSPRSALPTSNFKIPAINRGVGNQEGRSDTLDPG